MTDAEYMLVLFVVARNIGIKNGSLIDSTTLMITNTLVVYDSVISANNSGCQDYTTPGSPHDFISHSFDCGLNAGSFGGKGGIGVSKQL